MPNLWNTGKPIGTTDKPALWDKGTPIVKPTTEATPQTTTITPPIWNTGKSTKPIDKKASWDKGIKLDQSKSILQQFTEGTLGKGMATGDFDTMTILGKTLDLLGRPGYALKAVIAQRQQELDRLMTEAGLTEEEKKNPLNVKRNEIIYNQNPQAKELAKAFWRGLSGEERATANQLWENVGIHGIPFLGFASEIMIDPLMWGRGAGYSAITNFAAKPGLKLGGKVLEAGYGQARKIPQVANAADFVVDHTNDIGKATYNMFIAKSKLPELAKMVDTYLNERKWLAGLGINFGAQTRDAIIKEAKLSKSKVESVEANIVRYIETPKTALVTVGEKRIANAIKERLQRTYTHMTNSGVPISALGMARRGRMDELYKSLETAVGQKQVQILQEIDVLKMAIQDEISGLKASLKPLHIDVAHWSANPNITEWHINMKFVDNDLGTDFGSESAALARKKDIGKDTAGKVYYVKIAPRRSLDLTGQPNQLQYWDDPDAVLQTIYDAGAISKPEFDELKAAIPQAADSKYHITPEVKQVTQKPATKLIAQPTGDEALVNQLKTLLKRELTPEEMEQLPEVLQGKIVSTGDFNVTFNSKTNKYSIRKVVGKKQPVVTQPIPTTPVFQSEQFYRDRNKWYSNFRNKLVNEKGIDSIKYYALEDKVTPTYKVLTSKIINKVSKAEVNQQARVATMITKKEADVASLVNRAIDIHDMPVNQAEIAKTAIKLKVNRAEAKEFAQIQKARELGYFPRFTTKEAMAFLKDASRSRGMGALIWNPRIKNALERRTADFTLEEWNEFCKTQGLKELGGVKIREYFMRDPAYASAMYEVRAAKAITSAEFLQDVIKKFGGTGKSVPVGYKPLPDDIIKLYPQAKGVVFDPEIVKEITRVTQHYINPEATGPILRILDDVQNMWRKWTLAPFPKYHLRNMVGNLWNNYLADVDLTCYYQAQAIQLYRKYRGTGSAGEKVALFELEKMGMQPQIADEIIKTAEEHGVLGHGWYGSDVEMGIQQQLHKGSLINRGIAVGTTIENNARLAHYISKVQGGMTSAEAANSVKHYLFDYSDITSFEREVMRRLFPFYTWTRKNIPLQLEHLWKQPEKFAPLAIPMRMRDNEDLIRLKYARPDIYERLPLEFQRTVDTVTYVPLEGLIPAGDLSKLIRPQELLFELLSPYIRAPVELYMNKSMFFQSELQKYPQETQEVWRMSMPVHIKYLLTTMLPQARLVSEIDKLVRKQDNKQEELTPGEQLFSQSLSSIYKVDLKELRNRALSTMTKDVEELRKGMAAAHRRGRDDEVERIKKTYQQIKDEVRRIKNN